MSGTMLMATLPVMLQSLLSTVALIVGDNNPYNLVGYFVSKPNMIVKILMSLIILFEITTSVIIMITSRKGAKEKGKQIARKVSLILAIYVIVAYILTICIMFVRGFVSGRGSAYYFGNNILQFVSSPFVLAAMILSVVQLFRLRKSLA